MNTTTDKLPEYAVTIAHCGDPQPVIDELTEWLDGQSAPQIMTAEGEVEPAEGDDELEPVENDLAEGGDADEDDPAEDDPEPAEGEEIDETSGGRG